MAYWLSQLHWTLWTLVYPSMKSKFSCLVVSDACSRVRVSQSQVHQDSCLPQLSLFVMQLCHKLQALLPPLCLHSSLAPSLPLPASLPKSFWNSNRLWAWVSGARWSPSIAGLGERTGGWEAWGQTSEENSESKIGVGVSLLAGCLKMLSVMYFLRTIFQVRPLLYSIRVQGKTALCFSLPLDLSLPRSVSLHLSLSLLSYLIFLVLLLHLLMHMFLLYM